MITLLTIGSAPWGEDCVQTLERDYEIRALAECEAFKKQLVRHAKTAGKDMPEGFSLVVKGNPHDFRTYYDVKARFDDENEAAVDLAYWFEANTPEEWDLEARAELPIPTLPYL